jgi:hypothetical protein
VNPSPGALRLCHAVGLATRVNIRRWAAIYDAVALLPPADQEAELELLEAAIAAGLVIVNPGPITHSISLTAVGLEACQSAAAPE